MATVAHWTKAQLVGPKRRPLDGPRHLVRGRVRMARGHRTVLTDVSAVKHPQGLHIDLLHGTGYKPQHEDLGERG
jgi:hypothetical protein